MTAVTPLRSVLSDEHVASVVIVVTEDRSPRVRQHIPVRGDVALNREAQRCVAAKYVHLRQLFPKLELHVGLVRAVRVDDPCGDVAERVKRDGVHRSKHRTHLRVDLTKLLVR